MDILEMVKQARVELNATQVNWQENCLFKCDDILEDIIRRLESAQRDTQADEFCQCPASAPSVRRVDAPSKTYCVICGKVRR